MQFSRIKRLNLYEIEDSVVEIQFHNRQLDGKREDWIDFSEAQDGSIMGYLDTEVNRLTISTQDESVGILAPESCEGFFYGSDELSIIELDNFYAFDTVIMTGMFRYLPGLVSVSFYNDVYSTKLCRVDDMFLGCLELVDVSGLHHLDMTHVTDARRMFAWCESLEELDFTKHRMPNCEYMTYMCYGCRKLQKFNIFKGDTQKVLDAAEMFGRCGDLQISVLEGLASPESMNVDFLYLCAAEADERYGQFPPNRIRPIYFDVEEDEEEDYHRAEAEFEYTYMTRFGEIWHKKEEKLENIKKIIFNYDLVPKGVQPLDYSEYRDGSILAWISNKTELHITSVGEKGIAAPAFCDNMFEKCYNVEVIELLNFDTTHVLSFARMFYYLDKLKLIIMPNISTEEAYTMQSMFEGCSSLKIILGIERFNTLNVENFGYMFKYCESLDSINLTKFQHKPFVDVRQMIYGCTSLTELDMTGWDIQFMLPPAIEGFVSYCPKLESENIIWEKKDKLSAEDWQILFGDYKKDPPPNYKLLELKQQRAAKSLQRIKDKKKKNDSLRSR